MTFKIALLAASLLAPPLIAQLPPASGVENAPVIPASAGTDGRITFRLAAPNAAGVQVYLPNQTPPAYALVRGVDGVWQATVGPFAPGWYEYSFLLGGARVNSAGIEIPSVPPTVSERQDVPHGAVVTMHYHSAVQRRDRDMLVYLPPQYFAEPTRRFPVLYLFSGMPEDQWVNVGRANYVLDNQIASGRAVPMIVVMPNNTTGPVPVPALENAAIMEREMVQEIMPMIERDYRTRPDRADRAIAGLSFGGGTAFTLGVRHLDRFGYVAEFGTGAFGGAEHTAYAPGYSDYDPDKITPNLYAKLTAPATRPKLLFMSVGTDDPRAPFQRKAFEQFRAHGVAPVFKTYQGGHEFKVFRGSLVDLLPMLFK